MPLAVYTRKVVYGGIGGDALVLTRSDLLPVLNLFSDFTESSQVRSGLSGPSRACTDSEPEASCHARNGTKSENESGNL